MDKNETDYDGVDVFWGCVGFLVLVLGVMGLVKIGLIWFT